jgi:hypothetical protein
MNQRMLSNATGKLGRWLQLWRISSRGKTPAVGRSGSSSERCFVDDYDKYYVAAENCVSSCGMEYGCHVTQAKGGDALADK